MSGPLSPATVDTFARRPFVVFEKDMAQSAAPVGAHEELKIAAEATRVRAASARLRPGQPPHRDIRDNPDFLQAWPS